MNRILPGAERVIRALHPEEERRGESREARELFESRPDFHNTY